MSFFNNTTELRQYVSFAGSLTKEAWLPSQNEAIDKYLLPILGQPLIDMIVSYSGSSNATNLKLWQKTASAIAKFILLEYSGTGEVQITDSGIIRMESENAKSAYAQQVRKLEESLAENGYGALEGVLDYLFTAFASNATWQSSPAFTRGADMILDNPALLKTYFGTPQPHLVFNLLRPIIREVERLRIETIFEPATVSILRDNASTSATHKQLRNDVLAAIVNFSIAAALEKNTIVLTADGPKIKNTSGEQAKTTNTALDNRTAEVSIASLKKTAVTYLDMALKFAQTSTDFVDVAPTPYVKTGTWM